MVLIAVLFMVAGCAAIPMSNEHIADNIHIGMSLKEFLGFADKKANLEVLTPEETVYSLDVVGYGAGDGYTVVGKKLFHFDRNDKLFKMDTRDFRDRNYGRRTMTD